MRSPAFSRLLLLTGLLLASACTTLDRAKSPTLEAQATWVVLPFANHTETPLAGQRAEAIAEALLLSAGVGKLKRPPVVGGDTLFEANGERKQQEEAIVWARQQGARYALRGAVDEWRYKVGVDGEPAVGIALSIVDLASGETLWSGVGGKSGWSREALSAVAQKLMRDLLAPALQNARP